MGIIKRSLLVLTILVAALATLVFVLENRQGVELSFLGWSTPNFAVSVFLALSLISGMLLGPLLGILFRCDRTGKHLPAKKD